MASERRLEILGILLIAISVFLLFSLLGYNPNEEPSISPNVKVENPTGILGLILSHMLVKLGFGYIIILIPIMSSSIQYFFRGGREGECCLWYRKRVFLPQV